MELFRTVDKQNKGSLDIDGFQQFVMSKEANHCKNDRY